MDVVEQLVKIYYEQEWWQPNKMPYEVAYNYHKKLYNQGNIQVYKQGEEVIGYYEAWCINYHQLGRIICHEHFYADSEDIISGNICYLANTWIHPDHRRTIVQKNLTNMFFNQFDSCDYYIGHALRKKTQPIKVFKRSEIWVKKKSPLAVLR